MPFIALHEIDPVFKKFTFSEELSSLLKSLDYKRPVIIQAMYIFKVLVLFVIDCLLPTLLYGHDVGLLRDNIQLNVLVK